ncbi:MAG TPA: outer membrane lipoprotein-sorting protein [Myxococcota bacterium]|nr:outer membrane lipoprotein-sorting protein [Myxococcota bacterium]
MGAVSRLIGGVVVAFALGPSARGDEPAQSPRDDDAVPAPAAPVDARALAESYFDETERFDALLTYEVKRGPASSVFSIARRWRAGLAELLIDIREPASFDKWAMLLRETRGGSDDLFLYAGDATNRRVVRLASAHLERQAVFELFSIGDYRPTPRGELEYETAPDAEIDTVPCRAVVARTPHSFVGFDKVELYFAADTGLLLQSRFFRDGREVRRLSTTPADYRDIGGHRLPFHRVARRWADGGETEIVLQRAVETPDLPDELFTDFNLRVQHFPKF